MSDNAGVLQGLSDEWRHRNDPPAPDPVPSKTKATGKKAPAGGKEDSEDSTTQG